MEHDNLTNCPCGISAPSPLNPSCDDYWLTPPPQTHKSFVPLSLLHVFSGCSYFPIEPLYDSILAPALQASSPGVWHKSLNPSLWPSKEWFPILCFKGIADTLHSKKKYSLLRQSASQREWIFGSFLWAIWSTCMKMAFEPSYVLHVPSLADSISSCISSPPVD